ncbi:MAG TPA: glycosyltransferase family A protein [Acidimicrobiia bacterium]|nr:glycosyltransferase family A protein [Acidimicrobiia bacterium]
MSKSAVSVVIPTRNYAHYLPAAIESVLAQEAVETELIVVDDGSDDDTQEVVTHFRNVTYLHRPHSGVGAARNAGVSASTCDWVAFLDADDVWKSHKLRRQMSAIDHQPNLDLVYAWVEEFVSDDLPGSLAHTVQARPDPYPAPIPSVLLLSRRALQQVGAFREDRESGEALDWILRVREQGLRLHVVDEVLALRRVHATNSGRVSREAQQREYLNAIRRSLTRRRSGGG